MDHLYAPWRSSYFTQKVEGCVFCNIVKHPKQDEEFGVLFRDTRCFAVMNRYPYTPGHFMIIPNHHTDAIETLDEQTWIQMSNHVKSGVKMLKEAYGAFGVNIGMNLGEDAGAGIAEHVHYHLVPRWGRDTNFITSIGGARVYGIEFEKIYRDLRALVPTYFDLS